MLTQLDVINQCLASMALAPITEGEIAGNPYAQSAQASLTQATIDTLSKGWWFNERLLTTDPLPAGLLRVEGNFGRTLSWRGAAAGIYDHTTGAYLTAPYPPKTLGYVAVPFPDLPAALQAYIAALTLVSFQAAFDGSETKAKQIAGEVARCLNVVQEIDRNSRVNYKRLWELLAYGWWFNTTEFDANPGVNTDAPVLTLAVQGPPEKPLFLEPITGTICATWTGRPIAERIYRCRAVLQVPPEALPPAAAEWLRKASALDAERESLNPDPRLLAELNEQVDRSFSTLRRENSERVILREQSREFQARGWWFNTLPLEDCIIDDGVLQASFSADGNTGAFPFTINFTDTSTGSPDRWLWDFGDGTTSTLQNPAHQFTAGGTYSVTLRAYRRREYSVGTPFAVTITSPLGPLTADFTANVTAGPSPLTVTFDAGETAGTANTWAWDFENNGSVDSTLQDPTNTYATAVPLWFTPKVTATRSADAATAVVQKANYISVTTVHNGLPTTNGGNLSSVGVVVSGLLANATYEVTMPAGLTHAGFSGYSSDGAAPGGLAWSSILTVTGGPGPGVAFNHPRSQQMGSDGHATGEAARAAFGTHNITGYTEFSFWVYDDNPTDNRGGFSIRLRRVA